MVLKVRKIAQTTFDLKSNCPVGSVDDVTLTRDTKDKSVQWAELSGVPCSIRGTR